MEVIQKIFIVQFNDFILFRWEHDFIDNKAIIEDMSESLTQTMTWKILNYQRCKIEKSRKDQDSNPGLPPISSRSNH